MRRIQCLLKKEWAQLRRDRRLFGMLLIAPLIQLLILGSASNTDVRDIALAIRDYDHTYQSREFARALSASGYFKTALLAGSAVNDADLLITGKAGLILIIPPQFGDQLLRGQPASIQALVDGADSNFAVQGLNYLQKAVRQFSEGMARTVLKISGRPDGLAMPSVVAESRIWYNPDLKSSYYMVPAVMALLLLVTTMIVTSMALVKEREEGTMEQIIVTPLRPSELIMGKLLPFVGVGFAEVTFALLVIRLVFGVPLRGSVPLLYGMSGIFLLTTLGLGLFISSLVKTQHQAMMVATFFVMMPFVLLSGFAFPVDNMPPLIKGIAQLIPLKYYLIIIRGIFLKGAGIAELWPDALALFLWGVCILGLAIMKFHKRMD